MAFSTRVFPPRRWQRPRLSNEIKRVQSTIADPNVAANQFLIDDVCRTMNTYKEECSLPADQLRHGHIFNIAKGKVGVFFSLGSSGKPKVEVVKHGNVPKKEMRGLVEAIDAGIFVRCTGENHVPAQA